MSKSTNPYLPYPERARHNNPGLPFVLAEDVKGGSRKTATTATLLTDFIGQEETLEESVTMVWVLTPGAFYRLKSVANIGTLATGWEIFTAGADLSGYTTNTAGESNLDYTPAENNNTTGFFAGLLTSSKLKLKAALDKIVTVIKTKADLGIDGKVLASQLPAVAATQTAGIPAYAQINAYSIGDQVSSSSRFWSAKIAIAANTASSAPPTDTAVTTNTYWSELSGTHLQNTDTAGKTVGGVTVTFDSIKATQDDSVTKSTDQTITGVKTFGATLASAVISAVQNGLVINPSLSAGAATQTLAALLINPTFAGANLSTANAYILQLQSAGSDRLNLSSAGRLNLISINSTEALSISNPSFTGRFRFYQSGNNTSVIAGGTGAENITFGPSNTIFFNANTVSAAQNVLVVNILVGVNRSNGDSINITPVYNSPTTGTTVNGLRIGGTMNPQNSGTCVQLNISQTVNANVNSTACTVVGILYNPTLTNMVGVTTHNAIRTVVGDVLLGTTSGNVAIGLSAAVATNRLQVRGTSASTGNALLVQNSGATLLFSLQNDGYIDMGTLRPACIPRLSADPGTANNGDIYYNITLNKFRGYENGAWANLIS